jgi:hypothetical protein
MGRRRAGVDADLVVPHKEPPQGGQQGQLQGHGPGDVPDESSFVGAHVLILIKIRAMPWGVSVLPGVSLAQGTRHLATGVFAMFPKLSFMAVVVSFMAY